MSKTYVAVSDYRQSLIEKMSVRLTIASQSCEKDYSGNVKCELSFIDDRNMK